MAQRTTKALEAIRFLDVLRELIGTDRKVLIPKNDITNDLPERRIGWTDANDQVYLMPDLSRQAVEEARAPTGSARSARRRCTPSSRAWA